MKLVTDRWSPPTGSLVSCSCEKLLASPNGWRRGWGVGDDGSCRHGNDRMETQDSHRSGLEVQQEQDVRRPFVDPGFNMGVWRRTPWIHGWS